MLQESNPHRALGCGDRGPGPRACSRFKGAPSASSSCCAKDADGRFPRDASSTLEVTPAAAPVPSHPPHGPPPPTTTANGALLRAPRNLRARPHPPISARQEAPAAPLAAKPVRQTPVPPTFSGQTRSIQLHSLSPRHWRRRRCGGLAHVLDSRPLLDGRRASTRGQARREWTLTCLRLSSTRMRCRHPTPGHQTLGPALACGVITQPCPRRRGPCRGGAVTSQSRDAPLRPPGH